MSGWTSSTSTHVWVDFGGSMIEIHAIEAFAEGVVPVETMVYLAGGHEFNVPISYDEFLSLFRTAVNTTGNLQ